MIKLIFIGEKFYEKSGGILSSIYKKTHDGYERYDFGLMQIDLEKGCDFSIKQASFDEISIFERQLINYEKR